VPRVVASVDVRFGAQSLRKQQRHARIAATPLFIAPITVWILKITLPMNYATDAPGSLLKIQMEMD
jgi:hypothetical protein